MFVSVRGPEKLFVAIWVVSYLGQAHSLSARIKKTSTGPSFPNVTCAMCPQDRSYRTKDGYLNEEGCDHADNKDLTEKCRMCTIWVVADGRWDSQVRSKEDKHKFIQYTLPEGKILAKGCTIEHVDPRKPGTCDYTGRLYKCYCNEPMCNQSTPGCDWLRNGNTTNPNPKGCN